MIEIAIIFAVTILLAVPLGDYMARVYSNNNTFSQRLLEWPEKKIYRLIGVDTTVQMNAKHYLACVFILAIFSLAVTIALFQLQSFWLLEGETLEPLPFHTVFNLSVSYITNTNWQTIAPEQSVAIITGLFAITVQHFVSAALGMCAAIVLIRAVVSDKPHDLGNFWVDFTRSILYVLLPFALLITLFLGAEGVVQTFKHSTTVLTLEGSEQTIITGPIASQLAIKQLGSNGGGFFSSNSAHPFANPTAFSNAIELIAILLIPIAFTFAFGIMSHNRKNGYVLLAAMSILFTILTLVIYTNEMSPNPMLANENIDFSNGNSEGKETRFSIGGDALWMAAATGTTSGSVNFSYASAMPLSQFAAMLLMQAGEGIYGGVGTGLINLFSYIVIAAYLVGLMVGRTPEYLSKKIGLREIQYAAGLLILPAFITFTATATIVMVGYATADSHSTNAQIFTDILYAATSTGFNNGSGLGSLDTNKPFYNWVFGVSMLVSWVGTIGFGILLAGSLSQKHPSHLHADTLKENSFLFTIMLTFVIVVLGLFTFLPALALGPVAEHFQLYYG